MYKRILIPVDGSPLSKKAIREGVKIAKLSGAKVTGFFSPPEQCAEVAAGCRSASLGCVDCKKLLGTNMEAVKGPIRERAAELRSKPEQLDEILAAGAQKARRTAEETMVMVRERIGLTGAR